MDWWRRQLGTISSSKFVKAWLQVMDMNETLFLFIEYFIGVNDIKVGLLSQLSLVWLNLLLKPTNFMNSCKHLTLIANLFWTRPLAIITNCCSGITVTKRRPRWSKDSKILFRDWVLQNTLRGWVYPWIIKRSIESIYWGLICVWSNKFSSLLDSCWWGVSEWAFILVLWWTNNCLIVSWHDVLCQILSRSLPDILSLRLLVLSRSASLLILDWPIPEVISWWTHWLSEARLWVLSVFITVVYNW